MQQAITHWFKVPPRRGRPIGSGEKRGRPPENHEVLQSPATDHERSCEDNEENETESSEERHARRTNWGRGIDIIYVCNT